MLRIGGRLKSIASLVPECLTVADIGTDHGYVPAYLALSGQCRYVIASDIAEGPCQAARETKVKYGLEGKMDIRKAPGLKGLSVGEADCIVIAGMGGATILKILDECPDITAAAGTFVLQPMNGERLLRQWLTEHNFCIADEVLCKENNHIYVIMQALHTDCTQTLSLLEQELGPCIMQTRPELWLEYITGKAQRLRQCLNQMEQGRGVPDSEKYINGSQLLEQFDRLIAASL